MGVYVFLVYLGINEFFDLVCWYSALGVGEEFGVSCLVGVVGRDGVGFIWFGVLVLFGI